MTLDDILFLPTEYFISLVISALATGIVLRRHYDNWRLFRGGILFSLFAVSQLVFRLLTNDRPAALIGQLFYFWLFLAIVAVVLKVTKSRWP